jgi:hypothetical protein
MTSLARRIRALLLTLAFLAGGTSLPGLDVLLFHLHGQESRAVAHVEPADECTSHVGHCALGAVAAASGALCPAGEPSSLSIIISKAPAAPAGLAAASSLILGFHSRAPPVPHA